LEVEIHKMTSFFVRFLLVIVFSFLLQLMDSDYPFGIVKLFVHLKFFCLIYDF